MHDLISLLFIPAVFFVLQEGVELAVQAKPVVAADRPTASGAAPLFLLHFQEIIHSKILDGLQVFDHAHVIFGAVALIEAFEAFAGVSGTFKTETQLAFAKQLATIRHVGAVFPARDAARAVGPVKTLLIQVQFSE